MVMFQWWEGRGGGLRIAAVRTERKTEVARTRRTSLIKLSYGLGMLVEECWPSVQETQDWSYKLGVVAHSNNLSTWDTEAGRSEVRCHLQVLGEFRVNLD